MIGSFSASSSTLPNNGIDGAILFWAQIALLAAASATSPTVELITRRISAHCASEKLTVCEVSWLFRNVRLATHVPVSQY